METDDEDLDDDQPEPKPAPPSPDAWTTRKLLAWISGALTKNQIDSPRLSAEILLAHVLNCERLKLYTDPDREAEPPQLEKLRGLVGRALKHEPIQYLTGEAYFFGLPLWVDRRVLIPRPSSETIVEEVIQVVRRRERDAKTAAAEALAAANPSEPGTAIEGGATGAALEIPVEVAAINTPPSAPEPAAPARPVVKPKSLIGQGLLIADVCTGSGCIGLALAKNLTGARVIATDISPDALESARANAERCTLGGPSSRIEFRRGDLLEPLADVAGQVDVLVSNPPYIPDHEWDAVEANVKNFEPHTALRGGPDGLLFVRTLLEGAPAIVRPGGLVLVEIAACTADQASQIARSAGLVDVRVLKDGEGLDRVVAARRP